MKSIALDIILGRADTVKVRAGIVKVALHIILGRGGLVKVPMTSFAPDIIIETSWYYESANDILCF